MGRFACIRCGRNHRCHYFGVGGFLIGLAIFSGVDHRYEFASSTYKPTTEQDLNAAADHLAKATAILGITAVLAVLFRGRPAAGRGGKVNVGPPAAANPWPSLQTYDNALLHLGCW